MIITLCTSAQFFNELLPIKRALEELGHTIFLPSMVDFHHLEETALMKIQHNLIKDHFEKINKSDAIYVANFEKKGIKRYIGGSCLIEIAKAFDKNIPIFLLNHIPKELSYKEEILAMHPIVIGEDYSKIDSILKKDKYEKESSS